MHSHRSFTMLMHTVAISLLHGLSNAQSDPTPRSGSTYGGNYLAVTRDSETVASAFPDVNGIDLLSPYFTKPESILPGFQNGTQGPTDDSELGDCFCPGHERFADVKQTTFTAR